MNRDEAIRMIKEDILDDPWQSHCEEAIKMAIAALETLELLGKVLYGLECEHRPVCDELSGELDYLHEGNADGYEMAQLLVSDPAALHAEAKRLGIEKGGDARARGEKAKSDTP